MNERRRRTGERGRSGSAWMAVRAGVWARDSGLCQACGRAVALNGVDCAEIDHIVPLGAGGTNDAANLRVLCHACHMRRPRGVQISTSYGGRGSASGFLRVARNLAKGDQGGGG